MWSMRRGMRAASRRSRSRPDLVRPGQARVGVAVAAVLGLGLAVPSEAVVVAIGAIVLAIGYAYDLRFKGTPWSWAPFALGIPLLPVFAWLGAAGSLPPFMGRLVVAAVLAGALLAIANARADLERDQAAGVASVATALGLERSWWLALALIGAILAVAAGPVLDAVATGSSPAVALFGVVVGAALLLAGGRRRLPGRAVPTRARVGGPGDRHRGAARSAGWAW